MAYDRLADAVDALVRLVARLRGPGGCPWDAKQTDFTIRLYLLEECYEVLDAIEQSSPEAVCAELGDLLFQVIFLAHLASERGEFDFLDVLQRITEKMIRRHPHVFGDKTVKNAEEVAHNWREIKKAEKGASAEDLSLLDSVPSGLPALFRAHRLSERASKAGFDWTSETEVLDKIAEEMAELEHALKSGHRESAAEELGDLLFAAVNLARHYGYNAEGLLRRTNQKFFTRFKKVEAQLRAFGIRIQDATPAEMNKAWEDVKSKE